MVASSERHSSTITSPYTLNLVKALSPFAEVKTVFPKRRLYLDVRGISYCYFLIEGTVEACRQSDDRLLAVLTAPAIVGIARMTYPNFDVYIKTMTPCVIGKIPLPVVEKTIDDLNLWKDVAKHMMGMAEKLYVHNSQTTASSALDIIRAQLNELMNEEPGFREKITAERYIRNKTALSRSRVMRVLSELKKCGYIDVQRGILLEVKHIPTKY